MCLLDICVNGTGVPYVETASLFAGLQLITAELDYCVRYLTPL